MSSITQRRPVPRQQQPAPAAPAPAAPAIVMSAQDYELLRNQAHRNSWSGFGERAAGLVVRSVISGAFMGVTGRALGAIGHHLHIGHHGADGAADALANHTDAIANAAATHADIAMHATNAAHAHADIITQATDAAHAHVGHHAMAAHAILPDHIPVHHGDVMDPLNGVVCNLPMPQHLVPHHAPDLAPIVRNNVRILAANNGPFIAAAVGNNGPFHPGDLHPPGPMGPIHIEPPNLRNEALEVAQDGAFIIAGEIVGQVALGAAGAAIGGPVGAVAGRVVGGILGLAVGWGAGKVFHAIF